MGAVISFYDEQLRRGLIRPKPELQVVDAEFRGWHVYHWSRYHDSAGIVATFDTQGDAERWAGALARDCGYAFTPRGSEPDDPTEGGPPDAA